MDFNILKTGFKAYLEEKGKIDKDDSTAANTSMSIFMYADDFKEFLGEKFSANSIEIKSKSISELSKMEFTKDGKLVDPKDKDTKNVDDDNSEDKVVNQEDIEAYDNAINETDGVKGAAITVENGEIKADIFTDVFNELLTDDKFKKAVDVDGSGEIDEKELENFANAIKGFDKDDKDISVDDLLVAADQINNGVFKVPKKEDELTKKDIDGIKKDVKDRKPQSANRLPSRSSVGGASYMGPSGGAGTYNSKISAKTPQNMSEAELQTELDKANGELSEKQKALSSVLDGSDSTIKGLQDSVKSAYDNYQTLLKEVDETMAKQVDDLQKKIDGKQKEIDDKSKAISDKESALSSAETSYNSAKSTRENLEGVLSELQASNSGENDLSAKISEVNSQLNTARQTEEKAKQAVETNKKELETLKKEKKELETGKGGLSELNEEMTKLQADIEAKHPEVKQAQDDWNKAKENLTTGKAQATEKAQSAVNTAQEKVNKLQKALDDCKNNEVKGNYLNQYNQAAGSKIAAQAQNVAGTVGRCLAGVAQNLEAVYGTFPDIYSAYQAADYLASNEGIGSHFTEVQVAREDLPNLPAGAVVVWDNNANGGGSNVSEAGKVHGHISIALGNGMESSDHIQEQIVNRDATFRVFYPKS